MRWKRWIVGIALTGGALVYAESRLRPRYERWGATDDEVKRVLPGDELVPGAGDIATRAVTIDAPVTEVWPWLVQIGQHRAGFYSYSLLENLVGCDMHNADVIVPEWQHLAVGDEVWLASERRYGRIGIQIVAALEPGRAFTLMGERDLERFERGEAVREGAWSFVVEPLDDRTTRFLVRSRSPRVKHAFDAVHFVMERGMMLGLKARAERRTAGAAPR
jgi:hypothetical protein